MIKFPHVRAALLRTPWAIMEDRLEAISEVVERRAEGIYLSQEEIAAFKGERRFNGMIDLFAMAESGLVEGRASASGPVNGGGMIAVINVMGVIAQHASQVDNISGPGGTSTERLSNSMRSAIADPNVTAIILNVDSPGGNVNGVQALAEEIYKARGKKPIVAQCNSLMASAAYWIGAACDEIVMTPGSQAGSIGVYALHRDISAAAEKEGFKFTHISAGKYKTEGNQFEPLHDEARVAMQKTVDAYYGDFTKAVAKYRGVSVNDVRHGFGEGRTEKDGDAVVAGMADSVGTLDETIRRLASGKKSGGYKAEHLPVLDANAAKACLVTAQDGKYYVANSSWPEQMVVTMELLDGSAHGLSFNDGSLKIKMENGEATYEAVGRTIVDGTILFTLKEGSAIVPFKSAEDIAKENAGAAASREMFRRRRHAHRLRQR